MTHREMRDAENGCSVEEQCLCGARFKFSDGGWYQGHYSKATGVTSGDPLALVELEKWRANHQCTARTS